MNLRTLRIVREIDIRREADQKKASSPSFSASEEVSIRQRIGPDQLSRRYSVHGGEVAVRIGFDGVALIMLASASGLLGSCKTAPASRVTLTLVPRVSQDQPAVTVTLRNTGQQTVALSRTHCACRLWLLLEITKADGTPVPYPRSMPEFTIVTPPPYECVKPGGSVSWEINLNSFAAEFGGARRSDFVSFDLREGRHRIRARYADVLRKRNGCRSPEVEVFSPWVEFDLRRGGG